MIDDRLLLTIIGVMLSAVLVMTGCDSSTTPTPTPCEPATADLTQELVSADGTLTINIPADWSVRSNFPAQLILTNEPSLIAPDSTATALSPCQLLAILTAIPRASTELAAGVSLTEIGGQLVSAYTQDGTGSLGTPQEFEISGSKAVSYSGVVTYEGVQSGIYLLLVDLEASDTFINVSVTTAPNEQDSYADVLRRMIETIKIDPSAAEAEG